MFSHKSHLYGFIPGIIVCKVKELETENDISHKIQLYVKMTTIDNVKMDSSNIINQLDLEKEKIYGKIANLSKLLTGIKKRNLNVNRTFLG